jgi:Transcriptional regulators
MKLFDRIAKYPKKLTQNEKALVRYIEASYPHGILGSATDIAGKVGVSASTVVRFFAKLGYESFGEFQREVRLEVSSKLASPSQRAHLTIKDEAEPSSILDRVFTFDRENLNATREANSAEEFQRFVDAIARKDGGKVYVIGSKNSVAVAQYLQTHLNMCRPDVHLLGRSVTLVADELLWLSPRDTLVAVSIRRYSKQVIQAAQYFRQQGASVVTITDSPLSPIAGLSDHRLLIQTASASPFDSYTAGFTLSNAIVAAVALRRKQEIEALLERGDKLWTHFDVFSGLTGL